MRQQRWSWDRWGQRRAPAVAVGAAVVAIDIGAPSWLAILYLLLASLLVAGRLYPTVRRREAPAPAEPQRAAVIVAPAPVVAPVPARRALGYLLLSEGSGGLLRARRGEEIRAWCEAAGVTLVTVAHDTEISGEQRAHPTLQWALAQIAAGDADTLVVTHLQDLSPSIATAAPLLRWFTEDRRALVAIDLNLDTSTAEGRMAAETVAGFGGWERERISARTRRGLEAARTQGAKHGRTGVADVPELYERITRMREDGMTLQSIADVLNEEGVSTLRGGAMWRPSSVQRATGYRRPSQSRGIALPPSTR